MKTVKTDKFLSQIKLSEGYHGLNVIAVEYAVKLDMDDIKELYQTLGEYIKENDRDNDEC